MLTPIRQPTRTRGRYAYHNLRQHDGHGQCGHERIPLGGLLRILFVVAARARRVGQGCFGGV